MGKSSLNINRYGDMAVEEAQTLIDDWLSETSGRDLFSADEVRDHLLDIRTSLLLKEPVTT